MDRRSLELTVVDQPRAGLSQCGYGSNLRSRGTKCRHGPRFIMVLHEPYEAVLVFIVGQEMQPHLLGGSAQQCGRRVACRSSS